MLINAYIMMIEDNLNELFSNVQGKQHMQQSHLKVDVGNIKLISFV